LSRFGHLVDCQLVDLVDECSQIERFREEGDSAAGKNLPPHSHFPRTADGDDLSVTAQGIGFYLLADSDAVEIWHRDVEQDDMWSESADFNESADAIGRGSEVEPLLPLTECFSEDSDHSLLVFGYQYPGPWLLQIIRKRHPPLSEKGKQVGLHDTPMSAWCAVACHQALIDPRADRLAITAEHPADAVCREDALHHGLTPACAPRPLTPLIPKFHFPLLGRTRVTEVGIRVKKKMKIVFKAELWAKKMERNPPFSLDTEWRFP